MAESRWEFRPGVAGTVAALIAAPLLAALGFWQLDRAAQKEDMHREFLALSKAEPVDLNRASPSRADAQALRFRRVRLRGQFLPATFLLDNQVHEGSAGYDVYTAFRLEGDETVVLVNRGWIPIGSDRAQAPMIATPAETLDLEGLARIPSAPPLALGNASPEQLAPGLMRVQRIEAPAIAAEHRWRLLPYEIRLDPQAPAGFLRDWPIPGSGRERHVGYALQWFAMAGVVVILFVYFNLRRKKAA
ncbi:MAG: SURF1 family protein [Gammaproteobacteria bacterium]|nr:SURF1 family protein [Gammaproteobacteria bacterium]